MASIDTSGFNVPSTPYREYGGTSDFVNAQLQNRRFEYAKQREKDVDDWRKLNLIQELTNLDKYQTGEAAADAIGNQKASEILQRYTAMAGQLSPAELQGRISQDMQKTISGMKGLKDELMQSDKDINTIKQLYPSIDTSRLRGEYRADILNRRMKGDAEFANPLDVQQSMFNLNDPEFLSNYVSGSKSLRTLVDKPATERRQVLKGTPYNYTEYTAEIPSYMRESFDRNNIKGGFLGGKDEPRLELRGTQLPAEALPSSSNKPFMIIDEDVYSGLGGTERVELIAETRKKYPTYNNFSPEEKKLAERNVLYDFLSQNKSQYYPSQVKTPSASILKFYQGGGENSKDVEINNLYRRIDEKVNTDLSKGVTATRFNSLANDEQAVIEEAVKKAGYDVGAGGENVFLNKRPNGDIVVYNKKIIESGDKKGQFEISPDTEITKLSFTGTNWKVQPGVAEKRELKDMGEQGTKPPQPKGKTFNIIDPNTGKVILSNVSEADANKAKAKGYKIQ